MNSAMVEVSVREVRTAVNEGNWRRMRECFEGVCLEDSLQVVIAAADCSIAGQPGRIARLMFDNDPNATDYAQQQDDYQDCKRMARLWFKRLVQCQSEKSGNCDAVRQCIAELLETDQWKAIATVAELVTDSNHCLKLFAKHLAFVREDGSYGVEC